jgi:hypothetical protein
MTQKSESEGGGSEWGSESEEMPKKMNANRTMKPGQSRPTFLLLQGLLNGKGKLVGLGKQKADLP